MGGLDLRERAITGYGDGRHLLLQILPKNTCASSLTLSVISAYAELAPPAEPGHVEFESFGFGHVPTPKDARLEFQVRGLIRPTIEDAVRYLDERLSDVPISNRGILAFLYDKLPDSMQAPEFEDGALLAARTVKDPTIPILSWCSPGQLIRGFTSPNITFIGRCARG